MSAATAGVVRLSPEQRNELAEWTHAVLREAASAPDAERERIEQDVVARHLWLADSLARRFRNRGEEDDDLRQVARGGLVEAVRRFNADHGSFVGFAVPTITGVLKRHFRDHGWLIRPPRRTQELAAEMRQQWGELVQQLGADPTTEDVARIMDQPVPAVREAVRASQWYTHASLDVLPDGSSWQASSDSEPELNACEARVLISEACRQLTPEEQQLLHMRFFQDRTQSDIAEEIGTSQMQVSRLLSRTLNRLRTIIGPLDALTDDEPKRTRPTQAA